MKRLCLLVALAATSAHALDVRGGPQETIVATGGADVAKAEQVMGLESDFLRLLRSSGYSGVGATTLPATTAQATTPVKPATTVTATKVTKATTKKGCC